VTLERLPGLLVRAEGAVVFVACVAAYFHEGYTWWLLVVLALAPDLSFVGYAGGPRIGALVYDTAHTYVLPLALGAAGLLGESDTAIELALIWLAHIGADRAIGYGLKYPSAFRDTHLQRL
jgi:uncharacterized protein DUF4260